MSTIESIAEEWRRSLLLFKHHYNCWHYSWLLTWHHRYKFIMINWDGFSSQTLPRLFYGSVEVDSVTAQTWKLVTSAFHLRCWALGRTHLCRVKNRYVCRQSKAYMQEAHERYDDVASICNDRAPCHTVRNAWVSINSFWRGLNLAQLDIMIEAVAPWSIMLSLMQWSFVTTVLSMELRLQFAIKYFIT